MPVRLSSRGILPRVRADEEQKENVLLSWVEVKSICASVVRGLGKRSTYE